MAEYPVSFIGDMATLILIMLILVIISITLSVLSLAFMRKAVAGVKETPPQIVITPVEKKVSKPPTPPRVEGVAKPPPSKQEVSRVEIQPTAPDEWIGFASIEDLASTIGVKSLILFNQSGIPIESHNVADEERVAVSLADFVSIMRKLNPDFDSMISEDGGRMILLSVGKIGDTEVFALAMGGSEVGLELEEVRGFLRTYLSESLGRYR